MHSSNVMNRDADMAKLTVRTANLEQRLKMGDALAALGQRMGLSRKDVERVMAIRNKRSAEPMKFA
jgi:hypothetical protein